MSEQFTFSTETFHGPLETLLNLIEERKMSISTISLAEVTDAYLAYIEKLPELPIGETSQFILIASTLLLIKSRTLLPNLEFSEDERESVEELERRLSHYRLIRKAAKLLQQRWQQSPLVLAQRAPLHEPEFSPAETSQKTIVKAALQLISSFPKTETLAHAIVTPILALEEAILHMRERLGRAVRARFSELTKGRNKQDTIVYFLAALELVRAGSISVSQEKLFSEIVLEIEAESIPRYGT